MHHMLNRSSLFLIMFLMLTVSITGVAEAATKVLYVTHEPGTYHKYTPQMAVFKEIAKKAGWEVTYMTGRHEPQIKKLRTKEFAKGYDAIVYNFCFAKSKDLEAASNIMAQTRDLGVPALMIHCTMHSWWDTYKNGKAGAIGDHYKGQAKATPQIVAEWNKNNAGKRFPAWGDFTGIASTRHGPKKPIEVTIDDKAKNHPALKGFPKEGYTTDNTELYNNVYQLKEVKPILHGKQGNAKAVVLWSCPQGKSQVMGLTIGHDLRDWTRDPFKMLVTNSVNYLAANPTPKK